MDSVTLIFPNQLFSMDGSVRPGTLILLEDPIFFGDFDYPISFHKKKLVLHRASMKAFEAELKKKGRRVRYVEYEKLNKRESYEAFFGALIGEGVEEIRHYWTGDSRLEHRLESIASKMKLKREVYESPAFLCKLDDIDELLGESKKYHQTSFYIHQRKRLNIMLDERGAPRGGKWTYDVENRERIPSDLEIPLPKMFGRSKFVETAIDYVQSNFANNPGDAREFTYPITGEEAHGQLGGFLSRRLENFGRYQDGMREGEVFGFHSLLSSSLNCGLINPREVIEKVISYAERHRIPIASLEGYVRQVIGWREFVRAVYLKEGDRQRESNFWKHKRRIPKSFYEGTTGIAPVDDCIRKVLAHAYNHHIERLMVMGNFMLLCEFDPDEVYRWFMEMYIDAYDWVMIPNVYGMSQFADGGLMMGKPYISSSNYIRKMSDYEVGEWCDLWDGLFWRFVHKHRTYYEKNPRLSMMARQLDRMDRDKLSGHLKLANSFLEKL
jgi:deoxyribodipyrimidine photolyase-related protein